MQNPVQNLLSSFCLSLAWIGLLVFFLSGFATAQSVEYPFKSGECARYGAYYNWNFIWVQSGDVEFHADTVTYHHQKVWHLKATGKTFKGYDFFYSVRDTFETFCEYPTFRPVYSYRVLNHAKENSVHRYGFDYTSGKINMQIKQGKMSLFQTTIPVQRNVFDMLATAYNFRKFDFEKLFVGEKVPYRMLVDRKIDDLYFRYLGTENVKTRNGKEFRCHKVSVYLLQGDFFPEGEYMKVWFTADKNHLPVQVETKVLVGKVKALLLETEKMKYPLNSEIF